MLEYPVSDVGLPIDLDTMVRTALLTDEPLQMRIFANDLVPQRTTVLANYVEATFTGYSRRNFGRAAWGPSVVGADHVARIMLLGGPQVYTATAGAQLIYGVYIVHPPGDQVVFARRFAVPREVELGVPFSINPIITMRSEVYES